MFSKFIDGTKTQKLTQLLHQWPVQLVHQWLKQHMCSSMTREICSSVPWPTCSLVTWPTCSPVSHPTCSPVTWPTFSSVTWPKMFTSLSANMFTSDLANTFTSELEKCKKMIWPICSLVKLPGEYVVLVPGIRHLNWTVFKVKISYIKKFKTNLRNSRTIQISSVTPVKVKSR